MDLLTILMGVLVSLIFGMIGLLLLVNQANSSLKMLPSWVTILASSAFLSIAAGFLTAMFGPNWVQYFFPDIFWMYTLGLALPASVYWFFANRNPNKSKFVQAVTIAW